MNVLILKLENMVKDMHFEINAIDQVIEGQVVELNKYNLRENPIMIGLLEAGISRMQGKKEVLLKRTRELEDMLAEEKQQA